MWDKSWRNALKRKKKIFIFYFYHINIQTNVMIYTQTLYSEQQTNEKKRGKCTNLNYTSLLLDITNQPTNKTYTV